METMSGNGRRNFAPRYDWGRNDPAGENGNGKRPENIVASQEIIVRQIGGGVDSEIDVDGDRFGYLGRGSVYDDWPPSEEDLKAKGDGLTDEEDD